MQSVSSGDILHEMSIPIFLEKIGKQKKKKKHHHLVRMQTMQSQIRLRLAHSTAS